MTADIVPLARIPVPFVSTGRGRTERRVHPNYSSNGQMVPSPRR